VTLSAGATALILLVKVAPVLAERLHSVLTSFITVILASIPRLKLPTYCPTPEHAGRVDGNLRHHIGKYYSIRYQYTHELRQSKPIFEKEQSSLSAFLGDLANIFLENPHHSDPQHQDKESRIVLNRFLSHVNYLGRSATINLAGFTEPLTPAF